MAISATQFSWKWLAGFVDGEGCLSIRPQNYGYSAMAVRVSISQHGKQAWVLDEIGKFLEDQFVKVYVRPDKGDGRRDLQISEFDSVEYVLKKLCPHLIVKRERAEECLRYMEEVRRMKNRHGRRWFEFVSFVPEPLLKGGN